VLKRKRLPAEQSGKRSRTTRSSSFASDVSRWIDEEARTKRNGRLGVKSLIGLMPSTQRKKKEQKRKEK
jgi:hypothetical protein